ncbi:glycosyl hydrolase family 28-related protein [Paenibacillus oleatilyticus]|uniref:glycosyl hydrolase family 28-related protein n=1 Tax=Paenibacillus oleatilyticus TaxID=2594886 RepID=UPI001C1F4706|nr:glycosyl hydrolase family 28-related protein [Paenibacillus oleatilyticus]MBU7317236.1 glycoside hydrolase family 55 protein [Paenibacillus oleatilyticus]
MSEFKPAESESVSVPQETSLPPEPKRLSRRSVIATLGMAGVAAAGGLLTGGGLRSAYAGESQTVTDIVYGSRVNHPRDLMNMDFCTPASIAALRAAKDARDGFLYYVRDQGQEGFFYYDPSDSTTADNTGLVLVSTVSGYRFKRIVDRDEISVKWFGAKGDGAADDMAAIQAAIDAVSALGGGTVYFPVGTYIVSPLLQTKRIILKSNVNLRGEGSNSVIKVRNDAGDYWTIFGGFQGSPKVSNVRISQLRIDQNVLNNTTCSIDPGRDTNGTKDFYWRQFCIALFDFDNITIEHVQFAPICGVNTITLNNPACKNVRILNCSFEFVEAKAPKYYDNSAVYINARSHTIQNCRFLNTNPKKYKAFGAMETHAGQSVVSGNITDGYFTGIHIQSSEIANDPELRKTLDFSDMTISGNTFSNACLAVQLWPRKEFPVKNVSITGNTISINNKHHNFSMMLGIGSFPGVLPDSGGYDNITISGNTIQFQEEFVRRNPNDPNEAGVPILEDRAFGIGFVRPVEASNIVISGNVIKNCPFTGIRIGNAEKLGKVTGVQISDNLILNAGHYPAVNEKYKSAILLQSAVSDAYITDNYIRDSYDTARGLYSIRINEADGTFSKIRLKNNCIASKQGGLWLDLSPVVLFDERDGAVARFVQAFPPVSGTFETGSFVYVADPAVEQGRTPAGYKVTSGGTAGALTGVTASGSSGSAVLNVNDASRLAAGQWIRIGNGSQRLRIVAISGTVLRMHEPVASGQPLTGAVSFVAPSFEPFGAIGRLSAIGDTNGSTLAQLESEVNKLKQALREYGVLSL